jgi:putative RNA 2'-phosphotransferase
MAKHRSLEQLAKIISYILGHNPAEFGLVPDSNGFVKIKEFLKALSEEEGLKYVRTSNINEILITLPNPPVEIRGIHIRAKHRNETSGYIIPAQNLPKLLYTCVRRKAYPSVLENGIRPMGFSHVILSSEPDMAERMGKRRDPMPIQLVVQTEISLDKGITFYEAGETLYLAESIQPGCFTGPPLPKQKEPVAKRDLVDEPAFDRMPGSFILKLKGKNGHDKTSQHKSKQKADVREKEFKKNKKQKRKRERPPWRQ